MVADGLQQHKEVAIAPERQSTRAASPSTKMSNSARSIFRPSSSRSSNVTRQPFTTSSGSLLDRLGVTREPLRPSTAPTIPSSQTSASDIKRDSGIAPTLAVTTDCAPIKELPGSGVAIPSTITHTRVGRELVDEDNNSLLPTIIVHDAEQTYALPEQRHRIRSPLDLKDEQTSEAARRKEQSQSCAPGNTQQALDAKSSNHINSKATAVSEGFDLEDLASDKIDFSNRGSILIAGKKANILRSIGTHMNPMTGDDAEMVSSGNGTDAAGQVDAIGETQAQTQGLVSGPRRPSVPTLASDAPSLDARVLSTEELSFSTKVRNMYQHGDERAADWTTDSTAPNASQNLEADNLAERCSVTPEDDAGSVNPSLQESRNLNSAGSSSLAPADRSNVRASYYVKQVNEVAGGIEDWDDVAGQDVDRYGFIKPRRVMSPTSIASAPSQNDNSEGLHRVATSLRFQTELPRQDRGRLHRKGSIARSSRSVPPKPDRPPILRKGPGSVHSTNSTSAGGASKSSLFRSKDQRTLDEAADMLTLPPGLSDIAEQDDAGRTASQRKQKEWEREEKWQKMARSTNTAATGDKHSGSSSAAKGGGMQFTFNTASEKVVSRTWKGIPDRWRATAWHSFLSTSAQRRSALARSHPFYKPMTPDETLISQFHQLQSTPSPDDMQIDMDVPRTINLHIMFRRRYRGGQRLLFRVLHAISLWFPDVGYVQGMASLAATLLCYFDEEHAFVMCVRLWELRGLEALYGKGFEGLMAALEEFERTWLQPSTNSSASPSATATNAGNDAHAIKTRLDHLGITSTAYGTRWYLTLFSLSVPFPAQLRIWDVFMLLGDAELDVDPNSITSQDNQSPDKSSATPGSSGVYPAASSSPRPETKQSLIFSGADLSVLHATSAALIDATREILLDSDFENAMKVLTSFVPIKDEDLLMRVAHTEWKLRKRQANRSSSTPLQAQQKKLKKAL